MKQTIDSVFEKACKVIDSIKSTEQLENAFRYLQQIPVLYDLHDEKNLQVMNQLMSKYEERRKYMQNVNSEIFNFPEGLTAGELADLIKNKHIEQYKLECVGDGQGFVTNVDILHYSKLANREERIILTFEDGKL